MRGGRSHHTLLQRYSLENTESVGKAGPYEKVMCATLKGSMQHEAARSHCYFMTIPVKVRYGTKITTTYDLLDSDKTVGLLTGLNNLSIFRSSENRHGGEGEPDAMLAALGWFFEVGSSAQDEKRCLHVLSLSNDELCLSPYDNVISCGLKCDNSREDRLALEIMNKSVELVNDIFSFLCFGWTSRPCFSITGLRLSVV